MTKTVLMIPSAKDDDLWILLTMVINGWGHEVVQSSLFLDEMSSSEFEAAFEKHRPDLVITYFSDLPATNGWGTANELCLALRNNLFTKDAKLIYFVPRTGEHKKLWGQQPSCKADVYMRLPFDIDELGEKIRELIG